MLDPEERASWYRAFWEAAMKYPAARDNPRRVEAWAKSMALIAEQFHGDALAGRDTRASRRWGE